MTQGVLLFAQNNNEIDYVQLAIFAATRIKKFLNRPVSVITNIEFADPIFDKIIVVDDDVENPKQFKDGVDKVVKGQWRNTTRSKCFELSPYDETLVIDVDYVVNSDKLHHCWEQPRDFLIYKESYDIGYWRQHSEFEYVSDNSIPFYWATVFFFRKTPENEIFFTLVEHIKEHWAYYKLAYSIYSPTFRNDIAFSVAVHMMNGYCQGNFAGSLPGKLHYIFDFDYLVEMKDSAMKFLVQKDSHYICLKTNSLDMHVMNKYSLLRCIND